MIQPVRQDDEAAGGTVNPVEDRKKTARLSPSPVLLPPKIPRQAYRPSQPSVPDSKPARDRLKHVARQHVERNRLVPPLTVDELRRHAEEVCEHAEIDLACRDYTAIIVNNEAWRDTVAGIPYERRLLLLPQCLRDDDDCQASIDEFGLVCAECGRCSIHRFQTEAERLGYAVLVAEGSAVVTKMIEAGQIEAVVGVSCMSVLEECFPHMEARAIPGIAIPLLQDGCAKTTADLDWIWDAIHLTSEDRTYRLDLDALRQEVRSWFSRESLGRILGEAADKTETIAQDWLARDGKRWRPYLTTCVYMSLQGETRRAADFSPRGAGQGGACACSQQAAQSEGCGCSSRVPPSIADNNLKKLAVAVECFHKASLIHDDIEDGDDKRYGQDTLHVEHGVPVALNVGDFLLGEGYRLIGELGVDDATKVAMYNVAASGHLTLSRGQGAELCWARRPKPLSSLEVLDIFRQKTAPAFEVALRLGACYSGADQGVHDVLTRYSESLGVAYQIRDDLEDFAGEADSDDLRSLRPSLVLAVAHKRAGTDAERELTTSLWGRVCGQSEIAGKMKRLLTERGVVETVEALLDAYTAQATAALNPLKEPTLKGLLRRVIGKIFGNGQIQGYCREHQARHAAGSATGPESAP
ncbi:MAG: polyprenyl synthetase family protein [Planctomycetota bacterium]